MQTEETQKYMNENSKKKVDKDLLDKKINFAISENITKARNHANMTQHEISLALGISDSTYSRYEDGKIDIPMSRIVKIAGITNTPLKDIASGEKLDEICTDFKKLIETSMSEKERDNLYREALPAAEPHHPLRRKSDLRSLKVSPTVYGIPSSYDDQMFMEYITDSCNYKKLQALYTTIEIIDKLFEQNDEAYIRDLARATIKYVANAYGDKKKKELMKIYVLQCKNAIVKL